MQEYSADGRGYNNIYIASYQNLCSMNYEVIGAYKTESEANDAMCEHAKTVGVNGNMFRITHIINK